MLGTLCPVVVERELLIDKTEDNETTRNSTQSPKHRSQSQNWHRVRRSQAKIMEMPDHIKDLAERSTLGWHWLKQLSIRALLIKYADIFA